MRVWMRILVPAAVFLTKAALVLVLWAAWLPSQLQAAPAATALAESIDRLRQSQGIAAAALVMVDRDRVLLSQAFGVEDRRTGKPVNAETRFRIGSITKTFTSLALMRAQSRGLLRLDRPIAEFAPDASYRNPSEPTHPLTLEHLLEHTAGWPDMSGAEFDSADPLSLSRALALRPASRLSLWPPGLHHEYSNSGAGLASWVLESVSGRSFEDFARDEVFAPLGMRTASLTPDAQTLAHLAQGYDRDGRTPIPYWHILYRAAGGLNLAPRDMAPLLHLLLRRGRIEERSLLSIAEIARMERPRTTVAARAGLEFGYGLGIRHYLHRGQSLFGHGGDADGYLAEFRYSLASGRAYFVVITAFKHAALEQMQELLDDWLVAELPPAVAPAVIKLDPDQARLLPGEYFAASVRFPQPGREQRRLSIALSEGQALVRADGEAGGALLRVQGALFRRPWESLASHALVIEADGAVVLQGALGNWRKPPPAIR